tara:strand:+ start:284 stop:403 length:120 start_codon:yes stop_codon:yes gene_type:complete
MLNAMIALLQYLEIKELNEIEDFLSVILRFFLRYRYFVE